MRACEFERSTRRLFLSLTEDIYRILFFMSPGSMTLDNRYVTRRNFREMHDAICGTAAYRCYKQIVARSERVGRLERSHFFYT